MKRLLAAGIAALTLSFNSQATAVWKVEKGDDTVYIGGTIHVLSAKDYPLPTVFDTAYMAADEVYFETDIAKATTPEFQMAILQRLSYTDGRTIADDLSPQTLTRLKSFLAERGLPYDQLANLKASLMGVTLTAVEFQRNGLVAKGVDEHYFTKAQAANKPVAWLESLDAQVAVLAGMGEGKEDAFINYSLDSLADAGVMINNMVENWREGDLAYMESEYAEPMKSDFPKVYDSVLTKRNAAWLPQIEAMFGDDNVELVLVGMLHLAGEDSVFKMLEDKGYKVTRL